MELCADLEAMYMNDYTQLADLFKNDGWICKSAYLSEMFNSCIYKNNLKIHLMLGHFKNGISKKHLKKKFKYTI